MRDIGGRWITGTAQGPGPTKQVRPLDRVHDEDIETAIVECDDPALGVDTVDGWDSADFAAGLAELVERGWAEASEAARFDDSKWRLTPQGSVLRKRLGLK